MTPSFKPIDKIYLQKCYISVIMQLVSSKFVASNVIFCGSSALFFVLIGKRISNYLSRNITTYKNLTPQLQQEWHFR